MAWILAFAVLLAVLVAALPPSRRLLRRILSLELPAALGAIASLVAIVAALAGLTYAIASYRVHQDALAGQGEAGKVEYERGYRDAIRDLGNNTFLAPGERLANFADSDAYASDNLRLWQSAERSVKMASLYGGPFMPSRDVVEALVGRGVSIQILLALPGSPGAIEMARIKGRVHSVTHADLTNKVTLQGDKDYEDRLLQRIHNEISATIDEFGDLVEIRLYGDAPFFWKGTVVDSREAQYVFYDIPRETAPFRVSTEPGLVKYMEERHFDPLWGSPSCKTAAEWMQEQER